MFNFDEDNVQTLIGTIEGEIADNRIGREISLSGNGEAIVIGDFRNNKNTGQVFLYL